MNTTLRNPMRLSTVLLATLFLGACMHWEELSPQPTGAFQLDSNLVYRFKLRAGGDTVIANPQVAGDSIAWMERVSAGTYWVPQHRAMPLTAIRAASVQRPDTGGTLAGLVGFALALGALVVAASGAGGGLGGLSGGHL